MLEPERRTRLYKQLSARGWRKQEPGSADLAAELPRLGLQIGSALAERGLSSKDIAKMTGFSKPTPDNPFIPPSRRLSAVRQT
jgi:hypothetical protein